MDISINLHSSNQNFGGKLTKFSKENMDKTLLPILKKDNADFQTMVNESGYSKHAIGLWFQNTFGVSANNFFKTRKMEKLKAELAGFIQKGTSFKEIADFYGHTVNWLTKITEHFGLKLSRAKRRDLLDKNMPEMIKQGLTIEIMAKKNECSHNTVKKWLNENLKQSIVKYRHENNITLNHEDNTYELMLTDLMQKCFDEGYNLEETAKLFNLTTQQALRIKQKYGLKTSKDYSYELLDKFLPDMMKYKDKLKTISRLTGLSKATIARHIKKSNNGKTYLDIRLER